MEARMHDDPIGVESWRDLDMGLEITLDGIAGISAISATLTAEAVCRPRCTP